MVNVVKFVVLIMVLCRYVLRQYLWTNMWPGYQVNLMQFKVRKEGTCEIWKMAQCLSCLERQRGMWSR